MAAPHGESRPGLASIPNLQHPSSTNNSDLISITNSNINSTSITSNSNDGSTSKKVRASWYNSRDNNKGKDQDNNDSSSDEDDEDHHNKTPSPKRRFDLDLVGASTPLHVLQGRAANDSISFLSPMNKLNNLHLESDVIEESFQLPEATKDYYTEDEEDEHEDDFSLGDKTITNDTDSDIEFHEIDGIDNDHPGLESSSFASPKFISHRKRLHIDSPSDMVITPNHSDSMRASSFRNSHTHDSNDMSICTNSSLKLGFSSSDSTPCPTQPKRKKLKFKRSSGENAPSVTKTLRNKPMLNLSHSVKTTVSDIAANAVQPPVSSLDESDEFSSSPPRVVFTSSAPGQNNNSTPISQSTPSNSRASTPPCLYQEFGESVNGYKFVKPVGKPQQFSYETPVNNNRTTTVNKLRESYNRREFTPMEVQVEQGTYEIIGEFPMASAGVMDESEPEIHIGDKRINDPYLTTPSATGSDSVKDYRPKRDYRSEYFNQLRLPLPPPNFDNQESLAKEQLQVLVNDKEKVLEFLNLISLEGEDIKELVKNERIRWHPDRWASRFKNNHERVFFDRDIVGNVCQVMNSIIEELFS
ncbi:DNA-binding proteins Bright/BRCAA1/RBP1 and related proteins containing BRIGHT domain [Scheffersomyces stipitis CBS 6054]|uniref:DNA-binding proteins Bright/BRCAA1/RBP1 and related proteins containing BRIGHT domain n=1 Tax=Scheffersomyces stipitis (strain ATCC 58785 / CBS 6054 / NBRC 10063 / NRRL Y-11545) TaxID=322104 RepID=A3LXW9_PICST|nr:DNA-binding proteins Bright/BRCAA1/RBP1 and related proteins containing BRIGHT domain [Scheffersomyces stipitis CBS 6054]ABN67876.2 DNA-binding proteins Bright/BRCAA1/RBP1 and related proteins containing BRIGHT domain [Scheffersomyces stipitis CBS 6054]